MDDHPMKRKWLIFGPCLAVLVLAGCGSVLKPEITGSFDRPGYAGYVNPLPADEYIGFDFYIQATSYMSGFINDTADGAVPRKDRPYVKALPLLSDTAQKWEFPNQTGSYYRFDYENLDSDEFNQPYAIDRGQFENNAAAVPEFYSLPWYFTQDGRSPDKYEKILQNKDNDYNGLYDSQDYLSKTLSNLNKNDMSVVVTDMIDSQLKTDGVINALSSRYIADDSMAVSIFAVKSPFYGNVYTIGNTRVPNNSPYEGDRPFYILVLGAADKNYEYCMDLESQLKAKSVPYDYLYISSRKSGGVTENGVDGKAGSLAVTPGDADGEGAFGVQEVYPNMMGAAEKKYLTMPDAIYYQIKEKQAHGSASVSVAAPLEPINTQYDPAAVFSIQVWDRYEEKWDAAADARAADALKGSGVSLTDDNGITKLNLCFTMNTALMDDLGDNVDSKFKINALVNNAASLDPPGWLNDYAYTGGPAADISSADAYGSTTIGLGDIITALLNDANKYGNEKPLIADIVMYIAMTH